MIITYIKHSCFSVELDQCVLLFDYYGEGELPKWEQNKQIYVFASHKHGDHFNLCIFQLIEQYPNIHYFVGSDVRLSEKYLERNHVHIDREQYVTHMAKHVTLQYGELWIKTLRSTDAGVAFVIKCEDKMIYHAGDLNWWHWEGETTSFNESQKSNYQREINSIAEDTFDIAFVPLDGRLEKAYYLGMEYFLEHVSVGKVFPMHMWEDYRVIGQYIEEGHAHADKLMKIEQDGQVFSV